MIGIVNATVPHNEGWHFIQVGKLLERADKTTRLLDVRSYAKGAPNPFAVGTAPDALEWSAVLRSCSAWDSYKAIHGGEVEPRLVAEFLLYSEDFPRSVRFCIEHVDHALRAISGSNPRRFSNEAERLSGRLLAELQFGRIEEVLANQGLHQYVDELQQQFNHIGVAVFNAYISQPFYNIEEEILVQQEMQQQ
jgi:uncharacterized alpha-E superfamily protein